MKTAKVIDLFTRKEIVPEPYDADSTKDIIDYLMRYENPRTGDPVSDTEYKIIDNLLRMLENNSGVARKEVLERGA